MSEEENTSREEMQEMAVALLQCAEDKQRNEQQHQEEAGTSSRGTAPSRLRMAAVSVVGLVAVIFGLFLIELTTDLTAKPAADWLLRIVAPDFMAPRPPFGLEWSMSPGVIQKVHPNAVENEAGALCFEHEFGGRLGLAACSFNDSSLCAVAVLFSDGPEHFEETNAHVEALYGKPLVSADQLAKRDPRGDFDRFSGCIINDVVIGHVVTNSEDGPVEILTFTNTSIGLP